MSTDHAASQSRRSPRSLRDAWIALVGLSAVFLFEMLDNSVLNIALPTIGRELHASTTDLQCVAVSTPDQWPAAGDETLDVPVGVAATREDGTVVVAGTITIRVGPRPAR